MAFSLAPLPYPFDALAPHIDAKTMEIHHGKHHNAYVTNLNKALEAHADLAAKPIEDILRNITQVPEAVRQAVINNGGGHANHTLFWNIMGPNCGGTPSGEIGAAINSTFGSFDAFKEKVSTAGATRFGSGWAWLAIKDGKLEVFSTANQDSPYMTGHTPLLGIDVWEHAYYLNYQNRRPDYIAAWWNTVNWRKVDELYKAAKK
ncbi:MAG: superoxide dismutase [Phycisphaerae bacterium]|nr:MAG: superoxide dismutase [Planctomycetia bacterium]RIK67564.1 MAG: superoxide dismutase [Planctomycetota bacterium]GJQ25010.1 MAG: superoxide dismutase [Phycisphaerae bacterium]